MLDYKEVTIRVGDGTDDGYERVISFDTVVSEMPSVVRGASDEHSRHLGMSYREHAIRHARNDAFEFLAANTCGRIARRRFSDETMRREYAGFLASVSADEYARSLASDLDGPHALEAAESMAGSVDAAFASHMLEDVLELLEDE